MAADSQFLTTPKLGQALISTANANRDGTGTIGTVFAAGASGSEVWWAKAKARGTTTAGMIRIFLHDGTSYRGLLAEIPVVAVTPSATVSTWEALIPLTVPVGGASVLPVALPVNWSIRAATEKAESFDIIMAGGDF